MPESYGFIKLAYGKVSEYKDTSKMTPKEVVEEFMKHEGVSSADEYFDKSSKNTYAKQREDILSLSQKEDNPTKFETINTVYDTDRTVYGKASGAKYTVKKGNTYELLGTKRGSTKIVPDNDTDNCIIFQAPRCSGFSNGKYVIDENNNAIFSNGRIVLNNHTFNDERNEKVISIVEHEISKLGGIVQEGVFYRGANDDKEIKYLKNGTIKPSINHRTGESEKGLSVWEYNKYSFKHLYQVTGNVIDTGSDGEPILDVSTIKYSKEVTPSELRQSFEKGKKKFMKTYEWSEKQVDNALSRRISKGTW